MGALGNDFFSRTWFFSRIMKDCERACGIALKCLTGIFLTRRPFPSKYAIQLTSSFQPVLRGLTKSFTCSIVDDVLPSIVLPSVLLIKSYGEGLSINVSLWCSISSPLPADNWDALLVFDFTSYSCPFCTLRLVCVSEEQNGFAHGGPCKELRSVTSGAFILSFAGSSTIIGVLHNL